MIEQEESTIPACLLPPFFLLVALNRVNVAEDRVVFFDRRNKWNFSDLSPDLLYKYNMIDEMIFALTISYKNISARRF